MLRCKLCWSVGIATLVIGSAFAFRAITGECPIGCVAKRLHGTPAAEAPATPTQHP